MKVKLKINKAIFIRIIVDVFLVNLSFILALIFRYLLLSLLKKNEIGSVGFESIWYDSLKIYAYYALPLTVISILVFALTGFYTRKRFYKGKYKLIGVVNGVSLAYLLFVFFMVAIGKSSEIPRSLYLIAWGLSVVIIGGARVSSYLLPKWGLIKNVPRNKIYKNKCENILVIGGAGYIGSVLTRKLLDKGYNVRVLDALIYGDESLKGLEKNENFELIKGDFRNIEDVVKSMENIDAVIHLGAIVGDPACSIDDRATREINLVATRMVAEAAKGAGVRRFFFASTCSVYGASDDWLDERSRLNPLSLYAISKIESEKVLLSMVDETFKPTIFRLATVHGFSYRPRFDLVVNLLTAMAVIDGKITIFGGNQWRPFVHVQDVAEAFILALDAPLDLIGGKIYNLGDNRENYLISQIGEIISKAVPEAEVVYVEGKEDDRNYRVRFDKIRKELGFEASRNIEFTVNEVKEAVMSGIIKNFRDPKYSNFKYLSEPDKLVEINRDTSVRYITKLLSSS